MRLATSSGGLGHHDSAAAGLAGGPRHRLGPGCRRVVVEDQVRAGLTAPGIVWAMGECVQQYGAGEPYLPVLTALERLARRVGDGALIDSMRRTAPDWLAQLPSLVEPAEHAALVRRLGGSTSRHILRELASLLETLADERVLVLWLEDLHWADHSTLEAVDVLARRSERARLMVVATYRPSELRDSDAPLARLAHDLALHGRGRIMTLDRLPEQAVAEYLAVRLPGRPVSARLVRHVHRRSDGNPLFMVTVADDLVNRALVAERDGQWSVDDAGVRRAGDVPDTLRKLIEQQALHLEVDDRCLLEAACVAGVEFSAAAVAAALGGDQAAVEERCERLSRLGQFLASRPGIDWPDGTAAAAYAFVHALHHDVLYESIPAGHRRQLHERIAERLERAFAGRPREAAVELAMHFERARDPRRAVHYHGMAGDVALGRAANAEAIAHLSSAVEALKELPEDAERSRLELKLRFALGPALIVSRGYAVPEVERTYARALELARGHHDAREVTRALRGLWNVYLIAGEFGHARKLATELLARARTSREPGALGVAHAALGETLFHAGELPRARRHLERALALDRRHAVAGRTSQRPRLACYLGWALWLAGYPDRARRLCREGIDEARALARPHSHAFALGYAGRVHQQCGDVSRVEELTEELLAVCRDHDIPWWRAYAEALRGWLLAMRGEVQEATLAMRRAIAAHEQMGSRINVTNYLAVLAEIYCDAGDVEAGWQAVEEALAQAVKTGHRCNEPDMYRVRGELLLRRATDAGGAGRTRLEAERCLRKAMRLARRRSARSQELRAATSLARVWQSRGQPDRGRRLLAPLCRWFTEGADTTDVQAARRLLEALAPSTPARARCDPGRRVQVVERSARRAAGAAANRVPVRTARSGRGDGHPRVVR